jgi:hypothetical protein
MKPAAQFSIRVALFSLLASAVPAAAPVMAQSSGGGSISNDDKSLSGSREVPRAVESSKPARRAKPQPDEPRRASRPSGGGGNFDGSWVAVASGTPCGSSTERFTISGGSLSGELSSGSVSPNGSTRSGGSVQGLSWNSTGRFSGNSGSGTFVRSDGCTGRWSASRR